LQAVKTVYVTTREEFPRCRVDIKASLLSGYLAINPHFISEVERVTAAELDSYEEKKSRIAQLQQAIYDVWAQKPMSHLKKYEIVLQCFRKAEEAKWKARADELARLENEALAVEGVGAVVKREERSGGGTAVIEETGEERNGGDGNAVGGKRNDGNGNEGTAVAIQIEGNAGGESTAVFGQEGANSERIRTVEETTLPGAVLDFDSESGFEKNPSRAAQLPGGTEHGPGGSKQVLSRDAPVAGWSAQEPGRSAQEPGRAEHVPGAASEASETGTRGSNLAPGSESFPSDEARTETQPSCFPAFFSRRRVEPAGLATSALREAAGEITTQKRAVGESTMEKRASSATKWAEVGLFQDRVLEVLRIECWKMEKERDRIIGTTLELIKQFGAVWVENVSRAVLLLGILPKRRARKIFHYQLGTGRCVNTVQLVPSFGSAFRGRRMG
jgi:hypothetical protein